MTMLWSFLLWLTLIALPYMFVRFKTQVIMLTIASWITLSRIALAPVVVYFVVVSQWMLATIFFLVAMVTDLLDGFVARRFGMQSHLGQLLDPLADKILLSSTLYALLWATTMPDWQRAVVWFLIGKEIVMLCAAAVLKLRYNLFIAPSVLSRMVSLCEIMLVSYMMLSYALFGGVYLVGMSVLLVTNVVISLWLLIRYATIIITRL